VTRVVSRTVFAPHIALARGWERQLDTRYVRDPPDQEIAHDRDREPARRPAGRVAQGAGGEPLEAQRTHDGGQRADHPRPEQRAERREDEAVTGNVVSREPARVIEHHAVCLEEVGSVDLRGEIRGARGERQPQEGGTGGKAGRLCRTARTTESTQRHRPTSCAARATSAERAPAEHRSADLNTA
jgi:hypothetical protein